MPIFSGRGDEAIIAACYNQEYNYTLAIIIYVKNGVIKNGCGFRPTFFALHAFFFFLATPLSTLLADILYRSAPDKIKLILAA